MTVVYHLRWFPGPGWRPQEQSGPLWVPVLQLDIPAVCVRVCVVFTSVGFLSFVLHFSIIFSAAEIPEGRTKERPSTGQRTCGAAHLGAGMPRDSAPNFRFKTHLGTQAVSKGRSTDQEGEEGSGLSYRWISPYTKHETFPSHHGGCPLSLDITPFARVTSVQTRENGSHAESRHVPWAPICMILCKFTENS